MRLSALLAAVSVVASLPSAAQRPSRDDADDASAQHAPVADARAVLGIVLTLSGTDRDTLGALVTMVIQPGPAERAGLDQGNRVVAINGNEIRSLFADVGHDNDEVLQRRLAKALRGVHAGDDVLLRVYSAGRVRTITVVAGANGPALESRSVAQTRAIELAIPPVTPGGSGAAPLAAPAVPVSITAVLDALRAARLQLRRLEQTAGTGPAVDSLDQLDDDLGLIQRRLRAVPSDERLAVRQAAEPAQLVGLRLVPVTSDLTPYFGDDSDGGMLVIDVDDSWSPLRKGDVILKVDGQPVTMDGLRDALAQGRQVQVLRRARTLLLTLRGRG